MIVEGILSVIKLLVSFVLNILPTIPDVPEVFSTSINQVLDLIFTNGANLIGLFIRPSTIVVVVPLLLVILNFEYIYKLVMWIVKKLPFSID